MKHTLLVRIESEVKWTPEQIEIELGSSGYEVKVTDLLDEPAPTERETDEY